MNSPTALEGRHDLIAALSRVGRRLRAIECAAALIWTATALGGYIGLAALADHTWPGGLPLGLRRVALVGALAAAAGWLTVRLAQSLWRPLNELYLARLVERRYPETQHALVTALEIGGQPAINEAVRLGLLDLARLAVARCNPAAAVSSRTTRRAAKGAGLVIVALAAYAVLSAKPLLPALLRAMGRDTPAATYTRIVEITPPTGASFVRGAAIAIAAECGGRLPRDVAVELAGHADDAAGAGTARRAPLDPDASPRRWSGLLPAGWAQESFRFRVVAGDAVSPWRTIEVRERPEARLVAVHYRPPPYMRLPAERRSESFIDGYAGTQVRIEVQANVPIESGSVRYRDELGESARRLVADRSDASRLAAEWRLEQDAEFTLVVRDRFGIESGVGVTYRQRVRSDEPPTVTLRAPAQDMTVSPGDAIELIADAADDFGLSGATIVFESPRQRGRLPVALADRESKQARLTARPTTKDFAAQTGDEITLFFEAADNRRDAGGGARYQAGRSESRTIRVTAPSDAAARQLAARGSAEGDRSTTSRSDGKQGASTTDPKAPPRQLADAGGARSDSDVPPPDDGEQPGDEPGQAGSGAGDRKQSDTGRDTGDDQPAGAEDTQGGKPKNGEEQRAEQKPNENERADAGSNADGQPPRDEGLSGGNQDAAGDTSQPGEQNQGGQRDEEERSAREYDQRRREVEELSRRAAGGESDPAGGETGDGTGGGAAQPGDTGASDANTSSAEGGAANRAQPGSVDGSDASSSGDDTSNGQGEAGDTQGNPGGEKSGDDKSGAGGAESGDDSKPGSDGSDTQTGAQAGAGGDSGQSDSKNGGDGSTNGAGDGPGGSQPGGSPPGGAKPGSTGTPGSGGGTSSGGDMERTGPGGANAKSGEQNGDTGGDELRPAASRPASPDDARFGGDAGEGSQHGGETGAVAKAVDELERALRGERETPLLAELGWDRATAERFVREYRRREADGSERLRDRAARGGAANRRGLANAGSERRDASRYRPGDASVREGGASRVGGDGRPSVEPGDITTPALIDAELEKVPPEYRELLEAYYRDMARNERQ